MTTTPNRTPALVPEARDGHPALRCPKCDRVIAVFRKAAYDGHNAAAALAALRSALESHRCG